jgi:hypothetical protein
MKSEENNYLEEESVRNNSQGLWPVLKLYYFIEIEFLVTRLRTLNRPEA